VVLKVFKVLLEVVVAEQVLKVISVLKVFKV
jgi:hypothetical protein